MRATPGATWAVHAVAVAATAFPWAHGLGEPAWHHVASLALAGAYLAWMWRPGAGPPLWRDRAHLGIGVLVWSVLAIASGFLILYLKQDLKAWDLKDWAKWWHILWSWMAVAYFVAHTAANTTGLARAWRVARRMGRPVWFEAPLLLVAVAIPLTWSPWGAGVLGEDEYIPLTLWTWLIVVGPSYGAWLASRVRTWPGRPAAQSFVTLWLLPATSLANISGLPLTFFNTKETSLKYVAKYWHTAPSILFAVLVFAHTAQFWSGLRAHARQGRA